MRNSGKRGKIDAEWPRIPTACCYAVQTDPGTGPFADMLATMKRSLVVAIIGMLVGCGTSEPEPATRAEARMDSRDVSVAEYLASQFRDDGPGGVVLVARGAQIVVHAAYGLADVENRRKMSTDQSLPTGSITKSFTAGAILELVRSGRLALDDDVRRHVPDALVGDRVVTIEQLLTHTSGLPSLVDTPDFFEWAKTPRSTSDLLMRSEGLPFDFEPGTGFRYSDSGYILLGAVLERHEPGDWSDAVRALVGQPLGLRSVDSAVRWGARATVGYTFDGEHFGAADAIDWSVPHASGSLVATADDLLAWVHAWRDGTIATPELRRQAWASRVLPDGVHSGYGFGWKRCEFEGRTAFQHGGWVPGFTASMLHLPDDDLTAIALLNSDGGIVASYLARRALRVLLTGAPESPTHNLSSEWRSKLVGRYRSQRGTVWTVSDSGQSLILDLAGRRVELAAVTDTQLCAADSDGTWCFRFEPGPDGRAFSIAASLTCEPQSRAFREE